MARIDSLAAANHPMIDHLWRDRIRIGTLVIGPGGPLHRLALLSTESEIRARAVARQLPRPLATPRPQGDRAMSLIDIERAAAGTFPSEPFRLRHHLAGHPLLTLDALAELATRLDRDRLEYNSGKLQPNQKPDEVPGIDLAPDAVVRQIETCGAWMVLKNVETIPEYAALIRSALVDAAGALGGAPGKVGMTDFQGFIFVSSAKGVTPFHIDYEENFFVHIHGEKFMHVFDNRDRTLVSEADLETFPGKHRNHRYEEASRRRPPSTRSRPATACSCPTPGRIGCGPAATGRSRWRSPGSRPRTSA